MYWQKTLALQTILRLQFQCRRSKAFIGKTNLSRMTRLKKVNKRHFLKRERGQINSVVKSWG